MEELRQITHSSRSNPQMINPIKHLGKILNNDKKFDPFYVERMLPSPKKKKRVLPPINDNVKETVSKYLSQSISPPHNRNRLRIGGQLNNLTYQPEENEPQMSKSNSGPRPWSNRRARAFDYTLDDEDES